MTTAPERRPLITRISRLSMDDGPGLRTVVFFKGCKLSCRWCHNPETISPGAELLFFKEMCIECLDCHLACPKGAISRGTSRRVDGDKCILCGDCVSVCPARAIELCGEHFEPRALVELLLKDRLYYENSGGGVTFSGGEPTLALGYLSDVAGRLKRHGISVALQTNGLFDLEAFEAILLPHLDVVYFDLKIMDAKTHERFTGRTNERILGNFKSLVQKGAVPVVPRMPLVPGITATRENLERTAAFLRDLGIGSCDLLSYNSSVPVKRERLGKGPVAEIPGEGFPLERENEMRRFFTETLNRC